MWLNNNKKEKKDFTKIMDNENTDISIKQSVGYKMAFVMFLLFITAFTAHSIYQLFPTDFNVFKIAACFALFVVYYVLLLNIIPIITGKKAAPAQKKEIKKYTMTKNKNIDKLSAA